MLSHQAEMTVQYHDGVRSCGGIHIMLTYMASKIARHSRVHPGTANPATLPYLGSHGSDSRPSHQLGFDFSLCAVVMSSSEI